MPPPAPQLNTAAAASQSVHIGLGVPWRARALIVFTTDVNSVSENQVDVGDTTSYTVTGLENGVTYLFAVSALAQATYHISVDRRTRQYAESKSKCFFRREHD